MRPISISVSEFAWPAPGKGDLDLLKTGVPMTWEGQKRHHSFQKEKVKKDPCWQTEFPVEFTVEKNHWTLKLSGKIDGFKEDLTSLFIEEYKVCSDPRRLADNLKNNRYHPYRLQILLYAWLLKTKGLQKDLVLTLWLISLDPLVKPIGIKVVWDENEVESWVERRIQSLIELLEFERQTYLRRQSIELHFPHNRRRKVQSQMAEDLHHHLESTKQAIMMQSSTGTGKTSGVLFPTLKKSLEINQPLIYLTATRSQQLNVLNELKVFKTKNPKLKIHQLIAKSNLCMNPEKLCEGSSCDYAKDFFKKVDTGLDIINSLSAVFENQKGVDELKNLANANKICPHQINRLHLESFDVIVGDYNFIFSPYSLKGSISCRVSHKKPIIIIDEAHNLPDRVRDLHSWSLTSKHYMDLKIWARNHSGKLRTMANHLAQFIRDLIHFKGSLDELNDWFLTNHKSGLDWCLSLIQEEINSSSDILPLLYDIFSCLQCFEDRSEYMWIPKQGSVTRQCLDSGFLIKDKLQNISHVILLSATLKPMSSYEILLGLEHATQKEYHSEFPRENRKTIVIPQVSTTFKHRQSSYIKIKNIIEKICAIKKGNYLVFFPSFQYMEDCKPFVKPKGYEILTQSRQMILDEQVDIKKRLKSSAKPIILFAVQGGVFAEGIDFPSEEAIGCFIVGPGIPKINQENDNLKNYYETNYGNGFDLAYIIPAMSKVCQAAGRIIRSEVDRGLIVLIGERFLQPNYYSCLPEDWGYIVNWTSQSIIDDVERFWRDI